MDILETMLRILLTLLCGGILGLERGRKQRPAGFRTYILVCLGAALVMMTNEYICLKYDTGDPARMGAQVISGIGFLGAGTIIFTGHNRVKGLTTAAGLWAAACIGLAIGIGYYSGAILGCMMIFIVMSLLHNMDERVMGRAKVICLFVQLENNSNIRKFIDHLKTMQIKIVDMEFSRTDFLQEKEVALLLTLQLSKKQPHSEVIQQLSGKEGILVVEEV